MVEVAVVDPTKASKDVLTRFFLSSVISKLKLALKSTEQCKSEGIQQRSDWMETNSNLRCE